MESMSAPLIAALKAIERAGCCPEDELPPDLTVERARYLVSEGFVQAVSLEPPGHNGYHLGLTGFQISEKGRNAVSLHNEAHRKELLGHVFAVGNIFIGAAVTLLFEHIGDVVEWTCEILVKLVP